MIITYKTKIMSLLTSEIEFVIFSNAIDLPPVVTPNGGIYSWVIYNQKKVIYLLYLSDASIKPAKYRLEKEDC